MTQTVITESQRLFCAVELPAKTRAAVFSHLTRLRATLTAPARVSWEREDKLHLTLKFFGEVEAARDEALAVALTRAAGKARPLTLTIKGAGVFHSIGRPNVIWLGVSDEAGDLARLRARVEDECAESDFPREVRAFHPHVTLARVRQADGETRRLAHRHVDMGFEPASFAVGEIVLMRSQPGPGGTAYTVLSRHELNSPAGGEGGVRDATSG